MVEDKAKDILENAPLEQILKKMINLVKDISMILM